MDEKALNDERMLMEALVNTRFNYLLVVFTVIVTGLTTSKSHLQFSIIAVAGVVITAAIGWTIVRAQLKQSVLFARIKENPEHPAAFADEAARRTEAKHWVDLRRFSAQKVIGYGFPTLIPLVFVAAFLCRDRLYAGNKLEDRAAQLEAQNAALETQLARDEGEIQTLHKSVDLLAAQLVALEADSRALKAHAAPAPAPKRRKR